MSLSIATMPLSFAAPSAGVAMRTAAPMMQEAAAPEPFNPVTFAKSLPGIAGPVRARTFTAHSCSCVHPPIARM